MRKTDWKAGLAEWFARQGAREAERPEDRRENRKEPTDGSDAPEARMAAEAPACASARPSMRAEGGRAEDFEGASSEGHDGSTGEVSQASSEKAPGRAPETTFSSSPEADGFSTTFRGIPSDRPENASLFAEAGDARAFEGAVAREEKAGGASPLSLELLSRPAEAGAGRAEGLSRETVAVSLDLSPEKFPLLSAGFEKDARSALGALRTRPLFGRKSVAADRPHRLRFDAEALVMQFGDGAFRAAWAASAGVFGKARFLAELFLEGEPVAVLQTRDEEGRTVLAPGVLGRDGRIFRDAVGLVELALTLTVSDPETERRSTLKLFAEPVATALPDGPAARRIDTMADAVLSGYGRWLAPGGVRAKLREGASAAAEDKTALAGAGAEGASGVVSEGTDGAGLSSSPSAVSDEERGERPETKAARKEGKAEDESGDEKASDEESIPRDRVEALDRILRVYETGLPYFRANPRMKLRREARIDGAEKLRDFSYAAAAYMASHPEHLTPASPGRGIRVGMRHFLPKKVLVESEEKSTDTYENRVVVGFLKTLHAEVEAECTGLETAAAEAVAALSDLSGEENEGVRMDAGTAGALEHYTATDRALARNAVERLQKTLAALKSRADRIRVLHRHYRDAMPVADVGYRGACPPTPVFLSIPAYRMVYEAIRDWERSEWTRAEGESGLLTFLRQSRLYECWALTGLLEAFGDEGFRLVRKFRHAYEAPYRDWEQTDFMNTFRFVRREETRTVEVTLFYEPVVRAASGVYDRRDAPLFENGVKFVRTTAFSPEEGTEGVRLKTAGPGAPLFYTPDFLLRIRVKDAENDELGDARIFWAVADAKFSTTERVARERAMPAAFKYLFGMKPIDLKDRVLGLWLFCGKPAEISGGMAPQSLNGMGEGAGYDVGPDVHVVEMVPEEKTDENTVETTEAPWAKWIQNVLKNM